MDRLSQGLSDRPLSLRCNFCEDAWNRETERQDRFRTLREAFRRPIFDELYLEWRRHGDAALANRAGQHQPSIRSVGTLVTELLPFHYSQFGSLPGIA